MTYNNEKVCEIGGATDGPSNNQGNSNNSPSRWFWLLAEDGSHATIYTATTKTPASVGKKRKRPRMPTTSSNDANAGCDNDEQECSSSKMRRTTKSIGEQRRPPRSRSSRFEGTESCQANDEHDLSASRPRSRKKISDERKTQQTKKRKRPKGTTTTPSCDVVEDDQEHFASRSRCPKTPIDKRRIPLPRARNKSKRIEFVDRQKNAFRERSGTKQTTTRWFWHLAEDGSPAYSYDSTEPKESTVAPQPPAKKRGRPPKKKYSRPVDSDGFVYEYNDDDANDDTNDDNSIDSTFDEKCHGNEAYGDDGNDNRNEDQNRFDAMWEKKFALLQKYKRKHKTIRVDNRHTLGMWIIRQRHSKKIGKLLPDRVARLESIGIEWEFRKYLDWNVMCDFLGAYLGTQQIIPTSVDPPTTTRIWAWAKYQQKRFQRGKLLKAQMDRLDSIGFDYAQAHRKVGPLDANVSPPRDIESRASNPAATTARPETKMLVRRTDERPKFRCRRVIHRQRMNGKDRKSPSEARSAETRASVSTTSL